MSEPYRHILREWLLYDFYEDKINQNLWKCLSDKINPHDNIIPEIFSISVEWAGSGKILSYGLVISEDETLESLRNKIHELLPKNIWYDPNNHKIFLGHGGHELASLDQINNGDTLVVLPKSKNMIEFDCGSPVRSIAFSPNSEIIASGFDDGTVKMWSVKDRSLIWTLKGHYNDVASMRFTSDGKILVSTSDFIVKLWSVKNGNLIRTLGGTNRLIKNVALSPNSKLIALGYNDVVKLWYIKDSSSILTSEEHIYRFSTLNRWSWIPLPEFDDYILIWTLKGHTDHVLSVTFSPDGKLLGSGSRDKTVKLWSAEDGSLILTLVGHTWEVNLLTFSPDSKLLASGSDDGTIKLWKINSLINTTI